MRRAVFLDRDGVINRAFIREGKPYPPAALEELEVLPGVKEALEKLHDANYLLIVVTNQPDVARGVAKKEDVEKMHAMLSSLLPIDDFWVCYHDDKDHCDCRKPSPGLLYMASKAHGVDLTKSFMIGDRWRDIEAGEAAGCKTFFINYRYAEKNPATPDFIVSSLLDAEKIILGEF